MAEKVVSTPAPYKTVAFDQGKIKRDLLTRRAGKIGLIVEPIFGYFFLWAPILLLVIFSFDNSRSISQWQGFTFQWYQNIFNDIVGQEARFSTALMLNSLGN